MPATAGLHFVLRGVERCIELSQQQGSQPAVQGPWEGEGREQEWDQRGAISYSGVRPPWCHR